MTKKLVVSAGLLAKSQVAAFTRKDGVMVQAHDNGRQAAAPKPASGGHPKGFGAGQTVFVKHPQTGKKTIATYQGAKDGKSVVQHDKLGTLHVDHEHVTPARGVPKKADPAASRAAGDHVREVMASNSSKTGSAAPAKMKNVGSEKWPMHAKTSEALGSKHQDGSTHHVGGFEAPGHGKGDHLIHHDGKTFSYSGKSGKNIKTGEDSFEYRSGDSGEHRAWVTRSGHLQND